MSEQQIPEIPQSETEPDTEPSPKPTKKKIPARGFNIVRVEKRVTATFSIMAKVFVIILIGIAAIFIARELSDDGYVITQINVPASFEEAGYTGPVVAKRISNQLNEIIRITRTAEVAQEYGSAADEADVTIDMVGLGVPVRSFIELIGNAIGINRKKKITADITTAGNQVILVLNISGETPERVEVPLDSNVEIPLKTLIAEASEGILKYTNDRVLYSYYSNIKRDGEKVISHAKYRLEKYKGDQKMEAKLYASLASGLIQLNRLEAAEQKIKQSLALDSTISFLYTTWARLFQTKGDYARAIVLEKKAYTLIPEGGPAFVYSTSLGNIGVLFSYSNQSDSALYYYRKALEWDDEDNNTYYNLSYEYLVTGDTARCLNEVERALALGFPTNLIPNDPDMAGLLNHPRMKELMLKYGE